MCQLYSKQILIQSAFSWKFTCNSSIHQNFTQKTLHHKKLWNTVLNSFLKALNHFQSKAKKEQRAQKYNCIWTSFNAGLDQNCKGLFLSMTLPTLKSLITFRSFQGKKEITLNAEEQASWPWKLITGWRVFMGLQLKSVFSCEERFIPISTQSMQCLSGESSISNFQGLRDKHNDLLKDRNIMANSSAEADRQNVTTPVPNQKGLFSDLCLLWRKVSQSLQVFSWPFLFVDSAGFACHIFTFIPHFPSIFWFFLIHTFICLLLLLNQKREWKWYSSVSSAELYPSRTKCRKVMEGQIHGNLAWKRRGKIKVSAVKLSKMLKTVYNCAGLRLRFHQRVGHNCHGGNTFPMGLGMV